MMQGTAAESAVAPISQGTQVVANGTAKTPTKRTLSSFSLEDKVCIVTGGAGGLGWAISQGLAQSGADVAIIDLNVEEAQKQATLLESMFADVEPGMRSIKASAHKADVSSPESVDQAIASVVKAHGKIDILVAAAGFTETIPALTYPFERVKKLWGVNVDGTYLFAVALAKHLTERNAAGNMIFIGSMSGSIVNIPQQQTPYNASKAAVRHMAASLAVEWAPFGIRVNCISPGYMATPLYVHLFKCELISRTKKLFDTAPELETEWTGRVPAGRLGNPQDVVGAVVYLASDASMYVTGSDLRIDGGYTIV